MCAITLKESMVKMISSKMKNIFKYILSGLFAIVAFYLVPDFSDPGIVMAIEPLTMALIAGGLSATGGGLNLAVGNSRNQRKLARERGDSTMDLTNQLFGGATDAMSGDLSRMTDVYNQLGANGNVLSGMDSSLAQAMKKSYLDTTEGSAFMNKINQGAKDSKNKLRNDASLMGLSEEAYVASLGGINSAKGQATAGLAERADANRNNLMGQRMSLRSLIGNNANSQGRMALSRAGLLGNAYANSAGQANNIINQTGSSLQNQMNGINQGLGNAGQLLMMGAGG